MFQKKAVIVNRSNISKNNFKTFFVDFGRDFSYFKSMFLSKAPTERYKKI